MRTSNAPRKERGPEQTPVVYVCKYHGPLAREIRYRPTLKQLN